MSYNLTVISSDRINTYKCNQGENLLNVLLIPAGAISRFKLNGNLEYDTIKNKKPEGICGSGLFDIISELYLHQITNSRGSFVSSEEVPEKYRERLTGYRDIEAFIISENNNQGNNNIVLTQKACSINLIPKDLKNKVKQIGNGAEVGVQLFLIDRNIKSLASQLKKKIEYIELSERQDFQTKFIETMEF